MKQLSALGIGVLLLASSAFAAEETEPVKTQLTPAPATAKTTPTVAATPTAATPRQHLSIAVAGKIVATVVMADEPAGAVLRITSTGPARHDSNTLTTTMTGKTTVEVRQGEKQLFQIAVADGVVTLSQR